LNPVLKTASFSKLFCIFERLNFPKKESIFRQFSELVSAKDFLAKNIFFSKNVFWSKCPEKIVFRQKIIKFSLLNKPIKAIKVY